MGTTNYNFTYLEPNNPIDLVGDTTTFLDEIDTTIKTVYDNIPQFDPTELENDIADLQLDVSTAQTDIDNIEANFPIGTDDIQAGAITYDKLAANAFKSILSGMKIYHFDSANSNADNDGLVVPYSGAGMNDKAWLAGYYIPAWKCLIITHFYKAEGVPCGTYFGANTSGWQLPRYICGNGSFAVPVSPAYHPYAGDSDSSLANATGFAQIGKAVKYTISAGDLNDFTGVGINSSGNIGLNSANTDDAICITDTIVAFLGSYGAVDTSADGYDTYI